MGSNAYFRIKSDDGYYLMDDCETLTTIKSDAGIFSERYDDWVDYVSWLSREPLAEDENMKMVGAKGLFDDAH